MLQEVNWLFLCSGFIETCGGKVMKAKVEQMLKQTFDLMIGNLSKKRKKIKVMKCKLISFVKVKNKETLTRTQTHTHKIKLYGLMNGIFESALFVCGKPL